jgi:FdhD protein
MKGVRTVKGSASIDSRMLVSLPEKMRRRQRLFGYTGGIHAASLFDVSGRHFVTMEDIGRHNAVDKCVGYMLSNELVGKDGLVLQISGRGGFEILQKAAMAGIPIVSSVSAPSSLAIDVAETFGITLACFVRNDRFNVYANPQRILS